MNGKETLSVPEAGKRLGIGRNTSFKLARAGCIGGVPVLRLGRQLRVSVFALERVLRGERLGS